MNEVMYIFKSNGFYIGFINNNFFYNQNGIYLGWVEGQFVYDAEGKFRGMIYSAKLTDHPNYSYIFRHKFTMPPISKPPKPSIPNTAPPNPVPLIPPITLDVKWEDAF
jgi:hypothetical protein